MAGIPATILTGKTKDALVVKEVPVLLQLDFFLFPIITSWSRTDTLYNPDPFRAPFYLFP